MNKFRHVSTGSDMFDNPMNCNNSHHIENHIGLDMFENCMNRNNSYHIEPEQA